MDLNAIREAIADMCEREYETYGLPVRAYAYIPDSLKSPCLIVGLPTTVTYNGAMGKGLRLIDIPVYVYVSTQSDKASNKLLNDYASQFEDVITADTTLGNTVNDLVVHELTDFGTLTEGDGTYLGFKANIQLIKGRST